MKPIRIIAIASLSILTFGGCQKDNNMMSAPDPATKTAITNPASVAQINYELTTLQSPNSLILWNMGNLTTSAIELDGSHIVGNAMKLETFAANANQGIKLFNTSPLGIISIPPDKFDYVSFTVTLTSGNQMHALSLGGVFNMNNQKIPVQLIVDQQVVLTSIWVDNVAITPQNYLSNLFLDLGMLTNGISSNSIANASLTNGMILISASSNQNLYQMMLSNLQTGMKVQFEALPPVKLANPAPIAVKAPGSQS